MRLARIKPLGNMELHPVVGVDHLLEETVRGEGGMLGIRDI